MPNIRQFELTPQQAEIHPSEEGPSAYARIGREEQYTGEQIGAAYSRGLSTIGKTVSQVGDMYENHLTTQQFVQGMQASSQRQGQFEDEKQAALASPDPVTAMKATVDKFGQDMDKIGDNFTTEQGQRMWAEHRATAYNQALVHGMAEANTAVGDKTIQSIQATQNNFVGIVDSNPHALDTSLDQIDQLYSAAKTNLTPQQQTRLDAEHLAVRNQLGLVAVNSAARDYFTHNPNATPDQFPMGDLGKDSQGNSVLTAEGVLHAQAVVKSAWQEQKTIFNENSENAAGTVLANVFGKEGVYNPQAGFKAAGDIQTGMAAGTIEPKTGAAVLRSIQSMHYEAIDQSRAGLRFGEEQADYARRLPAQTSDPTAVSDMNKKIASGVFAPEQVRELYNNKQITTDDYVRAYGAAATTYQKPGALSMFNTPAYKGEEQRINAVITGNNVPGEPKVLAAQGMARRDLGVAMGNAKVAGIDPQSLLDPQNPNYWPTPERLQTYAPTQQDRADALVNKTMPNAPAPAAGPNDKQKLELLNKAFNGGL